MPTTSPISIRANGKLMLTGEYFVLDGAQSLALPTSFGQHFQFLENNTHQIFWKSFDHKKQIWFEANFDLESFELIQSNNERIAQRLKEILQVMSRLNPVIFKNGVEVTSFLEFPGDWGLGTSSTLIYSLAKWANIDPYKLLKETFGGSGYDIACASSDQPILFSLVDGKQVVESVKFDPNFKENLYFVYLGKKQNSREGIRQYKSITENLRHPINSINELTKRFHLAKDLSTFENCIIAHEKLVGATLQLPTAKELNFKDYWGSIKSLGAWGGDFILVTSNRHKETTTDYFVKKGFPTILTYSEMIKETN